jgi:hypothetical protein
MRARSLLASLAALTLVATACSGGKDDTKATKATTSTTAKPAVVRLTRGDVAVQSAGGDVALDDATQQAVLAAAQRYVDAAVVGPLTKGVVGTDYPTLFDAGVATAANGPDRAALTDEGVPKVTAAPKVTAVPVRIDALADGNGQLQLLAATFTLAIEGATGAGPLTINRNVELTLTRNPDGNMVISAYRVGVARNVADATTTTTATAGAPS